MQCQHRCGGFINTCKLGDKNMDNPSYPVMMEKDDELTLFYEMSKLEKKHDYLHHDSDMFHAPLGSTGVSSPIFSIASTITGFEIDVDDLLSTENDKNDYEWLMTPLDTPVSPSLEFESTKPETSVRGTTETFALAKTRKLSNPHTQPIAKSSFTSKDSTPSRLNISNASIGRKPLSSGKLKPSTTSSVKPTMKSVSMSVLTSSLAKPTSNISLKRSHTRVVSSKSTQSTSLKRSTLGPQMSTPENPSITLKPKIMSKSIPRKSIKHLQSQQASSPTMKQRLLKAPNSLPLSLNASPMISSIPEKKKPVFTSTGRSGTHVESSLINGRGVRWKLSSLERGAPRPLNCGITHSSRGDSVTPSAMSRLHGKANTKVGPIVVGTKMVEKVEHVWKLASPKQDSSSRQSPYVSFLSSEPSLTSLTDSLGFGRANSKRSLDMARKDTVYMKDKKRLVPTNMKPLR
ncbi:unnamed protein product [Cuscuta epithymum]|uniref:Uncharacterized protein n=1 Tax=Cuscuta epithymum TaxID=186058 RepID=A0AAV0C630_9ASTE|nr:unnamed protein product [Cuscuta epithymum]